MVINTQLMANVIIDQITELLPLVCDGRLDGAVEAHGLGDELSNLEEMVE